MTSLAVDSRGRPFTATFWRPRGEPAEQVFLVFHDGDRWQLRRIGRRTGPPLTIGKAGGFTLSRPLIVMDRSDRAHVVLRDAELGPGIHIASSRDPGYHEWSFQELPSGPVGGWEPVHDRARWEREEVLDLLVQKCEVGYPRPSIPEPPPEPVWVLSWRPGGR
jgi:hypothetical protein